MGDRQQPLRRGGLGVAASVVSVPSRRLAKPDGPMPPSVAPPVRVACPPSCAPPVLTLRDSVGSACASFRGRQLPDGWSAHVTVATRASGGGDVWRDRCHDWRRRAPLRTVVHPPCPPSSYSAAKRSLALSGPTLRRGSGGRKPVSHHNLYISISAKCRKKSAISGRSPVAAAAWRRSQIRRHRLPDRAARACQPRPHRLT